MSYNVSAFYMAETFIKNRLDALLKPVVRNLSGGNAPLIKANDIYCPRLSAIAMIDPAFHPNFLAVCALHGHAQTSDANESPDELAMRLESVRRFVLWMFLDTGRVVQVSPVDVLTIPGYENDELRDVEETGYHVIYENEQGSRQEVSVAWSELDNQFYLYRDGALVESRESERVA